MTTRLSATEWKDQAEKAGLSIDKYIGAVAVRDQYEEELQKGRRSSTEEKAALTEWFGKNGHTVTENTPVVDILSSAGVRKVQGTASFTSRAKKRLLLTHHPVQEAAE
jgi:hypothetical protein